MVDRQRDLRPCYVQNGSFLVAGASAKDNEDRDQSSTVPATGWDLTGVPGQEPVECGRESQTVSPRRHTYLPPKRSTSNDSRKCDSRPRRKEQHMHELNSTSTDACVQTPPRSTLFNTTKYRMDELNTQEKVKEQFHTTEQLHACTQRWTWVGSIHGLGWVGMGRIFQH